MSAGSFVTWIVFFLHSCKLKIYTNIHTVVYGGNLKIQFFI